MQKKRCNANVQFACIQQKLQKKQYVVFCNYYRDEPSNLLSSNSESFKYNTSIKGDIYDGDDATKVEKNETEIVFH